MERSNQPLTSPTNGGQNPAPQFMVKGEELTAEEDMARQRKWNFKKSHEKGSSYLHKLATLEQLRAGGIHAQAQAQLLKAQNNAQEAAARRISVNDQSNAEVQQRLSTWLTINTENEQQRPSAHDQSAMSIRQMTRETNKYESAPIRVVQYSPTKPDQATLRAKAISQSNKNDVNVDLPRTQSKRSSQDQSRTGMEGSTSNMDDYNSTGRVSAQDNVASQTQLDPKEYLNCGYLRLTKDNISNLEDMSRAMGVEPGVHKHMTTDEVMAYYDKLPPASRPPSNVPRWKKKKGE